MGIRLMICDDHPAVRLGINSLLNDSEIEVVFQAETCAEAVRLAVRAEVDVVLLDVRLHGEDGLEALHEIKAACPSLPVLMFSASDDLNDIARAHKLGADGYLLKSVQRDELIRTICRVVGGKNGWTVSQIRKVKSRAGAKASEPSRRFPLTEREEQVLGKLLSGTASNELIAEELGIDVETVKQYIKGILRKLHVVDRTQAALWALRNGFDATKKVR